MMLTVTYFTGHPDYKYYTERIVGDAKSLTWYVRKLEAGLVPGYDHSDVPTTWEFEW